MNCYSNLILDEERALYAIRNAVVENCRFEGPADGESALKESRDITVKNCDFLLRYPFWHTEGALIENIRMTETCRAALWYDKNIVIKDSSLGGIKAVRECENVALENCNIVSTEFGWMNKNLSLKNCELTAEYPFLMTKGMELDGFTLNGKYSFQYVENVVIRNSVLNTKDAFWHAKNVTVYDSVVKGEYLAWYSENVKFVRCKLIGTQPLCYAKNLILEDCEMEGTDLAFENSEVTATVNGHIDSVKNPYKGYVTADSIGEIIFDENKWDGECKVEVRNA